LEVAGFNSRYLAGQFGVSGSVFTMRIGSPHPGFPVYFLSPVLVGRLVDNVEAEEVHGVEELLESAATTYYYYAL
jgi:hypothetical protein